MYPNSTSWKILHFIGCYLIKLSIFELLDLTLWSLFKCKKHKSLYRLVLQKIVLHNWHSIFSSIKIMIKHFILFPYFVCYEPYFMNFHFTLCNKHASHQVLFQFHFHIIMGRAIAERKWSRGPPPPPMLRNLAENYFTIQNSSRGNFLV